MKRALSVAQVAERLGKPATFVRQLLRAGTLIGYRIPGPRSETGSHARWCVDEIDLETFIARCKDASVPTVQGHDAYVPEPDNPLA